MIIDREEKFNTEYDELVWTKIIRINPFGRDNSESTHVVKCYRTEEGKEYYLFEYIMADNNSCIVNNFNGHHWNEVSKQIDFPDDSFIYSLDVINKNKYVLTTTGRAIKRHIKEYIKK